MKRKNIHLRFCYHLCKEILIQWKKAWIYRISFTASNSQIQLSQTRQDNNREKLTFLYSYKEKFDNENRQFFCESLEDHLKKQTSQIDSWLSLHFQSLTRVVKIQQIILHKSLNENLDPLIPC
jgi:16S rRNA G527 N7-methylase RsmG